MTAMALRRAGRSDIRLLVAVVALTVGAWALTADRMAGMDAGPGSALGGIGWFALTWLLMMAAMMLPALTPMVVAYSRRAGSRTSTAAFAVGYLAAWLAAGFVAYAAIQTVRAVELDFLSWDDAGRFVAAAVIAGAGAYQLSSRKRTFLRRCCERAAFVDERYRPGAPAALRMGIEHGGDCIGASWALMAALFALGVMSLTWMALVAMLIAAEATVASSDSGHSRARVRRARDRRRARPWARARIHGPRDDVAIANEHALTKLLAAGSLLLAPAHKG
jgi:predicted metal-binding membrane protein